MIYLDSSAIVKLVLPEKESDQLLRLIGDRMDCLSSVIARVEVVRTVARSQAPSDAYARAHEVFNRVNLKSLDEDIISKAEMIKPASVRTLDSIHLGTALACGSELEVLITYDRRMASAAEELGVVTDAPA